MAGFDFRSFLFLLFSCPSAVNNKNWRCTHTLWESVWAPFHLPLTQRGREPNNSMDFPKRETKGPNLALHYRKTKEKNFLKTEKQKKKIKDCPTSGHHCLKEKVNKTDLLNNMDPKFWYLEEKECAKGQILRQGFRKFINFVVFNYLIVLFNIKVKKKLGYTFSHTIQSGNFFTK